MNTRSLIPAAALAALALLAGCGLEQTRPPLDATWGLSVRMAVENQKLDPTLGGDRPVAGLDGVFAKNALDAYRKSSEVDPQTGRGKEPKLDTILMVKESKQ
jgi:hypothetical protein